MLLESNARNRSQSPESLPFNHGSSPAVKEISGLYYQSGDLFALLNSFGLGGVQHYPLQIPTLCSYVFASKVEDKLICYPGPRGLCRLWRGLHVQADGREGLQVIHADFGVHLNGLLAIKHHGDLDLETQRRSIESALKKRAGPSPVVSWRDAYLLRPSVYFQILRGNI